MIPVGDSIVPDKPRMEGCRILSGKHCTIFYSCLYEHIRVPGTHPFQLREFSAVPPGFDICRRNRKHAARALPAQPGRDETGQQCPGSADAGGRSAMGSGRRYALQIRY